METSYQDFECGQNIDKDSFLGQLGARITYRSSKNTCNNRQSTVVAKMRYHARNKDDPEYLARRAEAQARYRSKHKEYYRYLNECYRRVDKGIASRWPRKEKS